MKNFDVWTRERIKQAVIFTLVFFVLLVLAGTAFVLWPVWRPRRAATFVEGERERLRREKREALLLLRDLEFDYQTGKILESDYSDDRGEAEQRAIELVRRLDSNEVPSPPAEEARETGSPGARQFLGLLSLLFPLGLLCGGGLASAQGNNPGEISGQVYTAEHPESLATGAQVSLVYRNARDEVERAAMPTDEQGRFCFSELPTNPDLEYVLRVDHRGMVSVGQPVRFESGESVLSFDVLIGGGPERAVSGPELGSGRTPEGPGGSMGIGGGGLEDELPPGHPSIPGIRPLEGRPVRQDPSHTILLTLALAGLFGLPMFLLSRKDRERERRLAARNG